MATNKGTENNIIKLTEVTEQDLAEAMVDEFGVKYSKDGKRLIKGPSHTSHYNIKEGTEIICDHAFSSCFCLSITIPSSVRIMEGNPFNGWHGHIEIDSPYFKYEDRALIDVKKGILIAFLSRAESFTIPPSVTVIGNYAFSGCSSLTSINIPPSVTTIGDYAFYGCSSLTSINISPNVTVIGRSAFSGCSSLTSINIPPSVTAIGDSAFSFCSSLTSINIPPSVRTIEGNPFRNWHGHIEIDSPYFKYEDGALIDVKKSILIAFVSDAKSYTIPPSVTAIGGSAFSGCSSLTSINIPPSVTAIGDYAFDGCSSLDATTKSEISRRFGDIVF